MKRNVIVAAVAALVLIFGVTGTVVMLNSGKAMTEPAAAVVAEDSLPDGQPEDSARTEQQESETPADTQTIENGAPQGEAPDSETTRQEETPAEKTDTKTEHTTAAAETSNDSRQSTPAGNAGTATQTGNDPAVTAPESNTGTGSAQVGGASESAGDSSSDTSDGQTQAPAKDDTQAPGAESDPEEEQPGHKDISPSDVIRLTNEQRSKNGLPVLETATELQDAANTRAKEISTRFEHTRPDGSSFSTAISGSYSKTGENIAYSTGNVTAEKFVSMWMDSAGHRANILGADYTGIAVGVYYDENSDTTYAVQLFVAAKEEAHYTYTDQVVAPTCTEQGYTLHICNEDTGKSYQDNYTQALGHDWDDGVVTKAATCTGEGEETFTCSRCAETRTETIPANGHKTEIRNAREATCTVDGYTGDTVCTVCGQVVTEGESIPATGHKTEVRNAREATCTVDGYTGDTVCTVCGQVVTEGETIPATGHHFADGKCTVCGESDPDFKPEIQYTYTETVVAPTCTEQGYTLHTCNEDADKSYKDNYTQALGHDWDGNAIGAKCNRCHTDLFVFCYTVEATCQDVGYDVYTSVADPSQIRKTNFTDPIDHIYENGVCTMCGAKEPGVPSYDDNYDRMYYNNTILSMTNQERQNRGLEPLRYASEYQAAADTRAQELIVSFSHTRPDGSAPETALSELGAKYSHVGENIAYVSSMYKPGKIVENWLASPGHCANMMSETFDSFVVGTACANGRVYAVQIFFTDDSASSSDIQTMAQADAEPVLAAAAPAPEAGTVTTTEAASDSKASPASTPEPAPANTPAPTGEPAAEAESTPEPAPEPTPEATPAPEATSTPTEALTGPESTPEPVLTPAPCETGATSSEAAAEEESEQQPVSQQDAAVPAEEQDTAASEAEVLPDATPSGDNA